MLKPRKRFGQHFLKDQQIIDDLIAAIYPKKEDFFLEIGPGQGALTFSFLKVHPQLSVVEIDRDLVQFLKSHYDSGLTIYEADVLKFDFSTLPSSKLRIIGNLPYNISTPLLFHLLNYKKHILDMHFMLQKEVVDRLSALPHTKAYGRLSIMMQYEFDIIPLLDVPPQAFYPPPKVDSAIVKLIPIKPKKKVKDRALFTNIVREAFSHRRKTLKNALKKYFSEENMLEFGIDSTLRPEALSVEDYVKLINQMVDKDSSK